MKTKFMREPTKQYMETLTQLQGLLQEEGLDAVQRVYADATSDAIKQDFQEFRDLENETPGGRRKIGTLMEPPGDHFNGWTRNGKRVLLISQPYELKGKDLLRLAMGAEAHGLDLRISAGASYYYPGQSMMVELWKGWNRWHQEEEE